MSWWTRVAAADLVAVLVHDRHFSDALLAFNETVRRIGRGEVDSFRYTDHEMRIVWVSRDGATAPELAPVQRPLPHDLYRRLAEEQWPPMAALSAGGYRISLPAITASGLWTPPSATPDAMTPREPWVSMFPGQSVAEFYVYRDRMRRLMALAAQDAGAAAREAESTVRERTATVLCPTELPFWDLRAAESEEDTLDDARESFGVEASSWTELRQQTAFRAAVGRRSLSVLVAHGWAGLIAIQLFNTLRSKGICTYRGCFRERVSIRGRYCAEHAATAQVANSTNRQRRYRRRLKSS